MKALIIIGCILLALFLIGLIRAGVEAEYSQDGFSLRLHGGPFRFVIFPRKKADTQKAPREKKKKQKKKSEPEGEQDKPPKKIGGTIDLVLQALPVLKDFLSRFFHKLLIKDLTVYFGSGGEDPYKAAMNFGYVSAAAGMILPVLENNFRVKKRDIRTNISFDADKPYIYLHVWLSIALWEVLYAAWVFVKFGFRYFVCNQNRKAVNENGKTSDRGSDGVHHVEDPGNG